MNSCTFILFMIYCEATTSQNHDDYYNVGTVLFSRSDLEKKRWNKREVQLLQARQHFQDLLPPPSFVNAQDGKSINSLLEYFKDAYSTVKREAKGGEMDNIMTAAVSDLLGGYLKLWALPITKFSYYGGTADQYDTLSLYDLYDEIKSYLNTNGIGWRSPNADLLSSVSLDIPLYHTQIARESQFYPCDNLALYEKTPNGFTIAMPSIDWRKNGETMFIPIKNISLVSLNNPESSDALPKYYDTAKNCISENERHDFDQKFQFWLDSEVLPHLNDEKLYPALGCVLTLVNKTRSLCDTVIDMYNDNLPALKKTRIAGIPIDLSSKKMMVLVVIIILEVAWCIPACCYLACTKCKKKDKQSNVYMYVDHPPSQKPQCQTRSEYSSTLSNVNRNMSCEAFLDERPSRYSRSQGHSYPSRHDRQERWNYDYDAFVEKGFSNQSLPKRVQTTSSEILTMNIASTLNEPPEQPTTDALPRKKHINKIGVSKKTGTNKVFAKETSTISYPDIYNCSMPITADDIAKPEPIKSYPTMQQLETTKTVTLLKLRDNDAISKIPEIMREEKNTQMNLPQAISKCNQSIEKSSKTTMVSMTNTEFKVMRTQTQVDMKKKGVRLVSGKPYLEITIDNRPHKEVTDHVSFDLSGHKSKQAKPSKIPKRNFNNSEAQTYKSKLAKKAQNPLCSKRSFIPQLKQHVSKDDLNIKDIIMKTSSKQSKLNTTF